MFVILTDVEYYISSRINTWMPCRLTSAPYS